MAPSKSPRHHMEISHTTIIWLDLLIWKTLQRLTFKHHYGKEGQARCNEELVMWSTCGLHNALGYCSLDKVWKLTSTRATRMTTLSSKPLLNYLIKLMKIHKKCRCLTQCRLSDRRVSAKLTAKCSFEMLRGSSLLNISRVCLWNK